MEWAQKIYSPVEWGIIYYIYKYYNETLRMFTDCKRQY
jgi:hypothetical protein